MIEVKKDNISDVFSDEDINCAVNVFNGIMYEFDQGMYLPGRRNGYAVDLTIACYILGINYIELLEKLREDHVFGGSGESFNDTLDRFEVVDGYCSCRWFDEYVTGYMLDEKYHVVKSEKLPEDHKYRVVLI